MTTKLTLTIEKSIIQSAKSYAKGTGRSLSELIENYWETITKESGEERLSLKLKKIVGSVKLPKNFDQEKNYVLILNKNTYEKGLSGHYYYC